MKEPSLQACIRLTLARPAGQVHLNSAEAKAGLRVSIQASVLSFALALTPLNHYRNPLPNPTTHRTKRITPFDAMQLAGSRCDQTRTAGSQRMAQRNSPPFGLTRGLPSCRPSRRDTARPCTPFCQSAAACRQRWPCRLEPVLGMAPISGWTCNRNTICGKRSQG